MIHLLFSLITSLQELVDRAAADGKFSGVVMLAKDGQPQFARAYGFADLSEASRRALTDRVLVDWMQRDLSRDIVSDRRLEGFDTVSMTRRVAAVLDRAAGAN